MEPGLAKSSGSFHVSLREGNVMFRLCWCSVCQCRLGLVSSTLLVCNNTFLLLVTQFISNHEASASLPGKTKTKNTAQMGVKSIRGPQLCWLGGGVGVSGSSPKIPEEKQ